MTPGRKQHERDNTRASCALRGSTGSRGKYLRLSPEDRAKVQERIERAGGARLRSAGHSASCVADTAVARAARQRPRPMTAAGGKRSSDDLGCAVEKGW